MSDLRDYLIRVLTEGLIVDTKSQNLAADLCTYFDNHNTADLKTFYGKGSSTIYFENSKGVTYLELACIDNSILVFKTPAYDGILSPLMSGKILMVVMSFLENNDDINSYDLVGGLANKKEKNEVDFGIV